MNAPEVIQNSLKCHAVQWTDDGCPTKLGCEHCPLVNDYHDPDELFKDALELIEELQKKIPQWISVKEKLPETDNYCIVFEPGYGCEACMYYGDGEWLTPDLSNVTRFVSHWMPLPEPPKEEV